MAITGVENIYFPVLNEWILEHIREASEKKVVASEIAENMLLANVIEVLNIFIKYGYYSDPDDIEAVIRPLLELLNGFTDLPFHCDPSKGGFVLGKLFCFTL